MRRKSERTASKKSKPSPEKKEKTEKVKRTKTRRRKQSSSSDSESPEEGNPVVTNEVVDIKSNDPPEVEKEESPEESQEQVWHVKTAESSGDVGEIKKLKICLTRPPSTPERVDRSPRSKRKVSRATSSSDTQSVEGEDKKKTRRSKRGTTEPKEVTDKTDEIQGDQAEILKTETSIYSVAEVDNTVNNEEPSTDEAPVSTTNEEPKCDKAEPTEEQNVEEQEASEQSTEKVQEKPSDADTTVASPMCEVDKDPADTSPQKSPYRKRSLSMEKSEILELHAEESRCESSEVSFSESQEAKSKTTLEEEKDANLESNEVSIHKNPTEISGQTESDNNDQVTINENHVVEGTTTIEKESSCVLDVNQDAAVKSSDNVLVQEINISENKSEDHTPQDVFNGETRPLVVNRKRRWGSRASKLVTQKSITISTDVLKEIIPDVKPVEFDEVIEEKKHKRIEVPEKIERPILPKIVIDNTENIEVNKKEQSIEDKDKENVKLKETNLVSMRKISIVKDNNSIIARPPSPPRHKQSNILYITNLVRPFTVSQLKNLLQRTGRIVDNEFWINRIKSKCYVKYETEDHAVETRHALHGVTWPVSNPKTLHVDFSTQDEFDKAKACEESNNAQVSTMPGTVEDWLREQDLKREKGELDKPWERKAAMREWDVGKNEKIKEVGRPDKIQRDERPLERRRHRTPERSPEPARKFKKKDEEAPAKLLDDLFRKTKTTPCIYWLPLSAETIAVKEEQRRQHMAEHERRLQELRRTHRRH